MNTYQIYNYVYTELNDVSFYTEVLCVDSAKKYHRFTTLQMKNLKEQGNAFKIGDLELSYSWNVNIEDNQVVSGVLTPELSEVFNYIKQNGADFMFVKNNQRVQRKIEAINEVVNQFLSN